MATSIKKQTLSGTNLFSSKIDVPSYNMANSLAGALSSKLNEMGSWNIIDSNQTIFDNNTHILTIPRTWGRIGDLYIDLYLPANTYVAKTITSMIKEIRFNLDRKSTRLNSSHIQKSRMPSSA